MTINNHYYCVVLFNSSNNLWIDNNAPYNGNTKKGGIVIIDFGTEYYKEPKPMAYNFTYDSQYNNTNIPINLV